ncbi:MAG: zinc ribbon domain-containing protein [Candidatus Diapherotrites archaeon]
MVKDSSASLKNVLTLIKFFTDVSLIATIVFAILFVIGLFMIKADSKPSQQIQATQPNEKAIFCRACGAKNSQNSKFCEKCGEKI